jgi:hypothetical protein
MYNVTLRSILVPIIFHIISKTARFSEKKVIEYKMCILISNTFSEKLLILSIIQRVIVINVYWPSSKVSVILVRF